MSTTVIVPTHNGRDRIGVLVPAYNEADNVGRVLDRIPPEVCGVPIAVLNGLRQLVLGVRQACFVVLLDHGGRRVDIACRLVPHLVAWQLRVVTGL